MQPDQPTYQQPLPNQSVAYLEANSNRLATQ